MIPLPIANGLYKDRSLPNSHQLCKNWYVSIVETQGLSQKVLYGTPGLTERGNAGGINRTNRGAHTKEGVPYFVNGDTLYSFTRQVIPDGEDIYSLNALGTVAGSDRVSMDDNGAQLMLIGGNIGYIYDESSTDWALQNTPEDNDWNSVVFGNSLYVAVSDEGTNRVMTSPDGEVWTARSASSAESWNDVTFGNNLYVAVAQTGGAGTNFCMTSSDGITWTGRSIGSANWQAVAYGNGLFVAVGFGANCETSPDGITWTNRTIPNEGWTDVIWDGSQFVAVAASDSGSSIATSPDGITWTAQTTPGNSENWVSIAFGNGRYVAVSDNLPSRAMISSDAQGWNEIDVPQEGAWQSVVFALNRFVAVGTDLFIGGSQSKNIMFSYDGINWTAVASPSDTAWNAITYGDKFVAVGEGATGQTAMTSTNGGDPFKIITEYDSDFTANGTPEKVRFVDSYFAVTTDQKKWIRSAQNNGLDWTATDFGSAEADPDDIQAIEILNNNVYIFGTETTEEFDNVGGSGFGFLRSGIIFDKGTIAPDSVIKTTNGITFLGGGKDETPAFWVLQGNEMVKISHPGIDNELNQMSLSDLESCYAIYYSEAGEFFVCFTFPSITYGYGFASQEWHQRESSGLKWRVAAVTTGYGTLWAGDTIDGRIGEMSIDIFDEYGNFIEAQVSSPNFSNQGERAFYPKIEATMEAGVGDSSTPNPILVYDYSDNGKTFRGARERKVGAKGEYNKRTIWRRNGSASRYRTNRFTYTGKTKRSFLKLEADVEAA